MSVLGIDGGSVLQVSESGHVQRESEVERHRDRQTDRQTDRQRERETGKEEESERKERENLNLNCLLSETLISYLSVKISFKYEYYKFAHVLDYANYTNFCL